MSVTDVVGAQSTGGAPGELDSNLPVDDAAIGQYQRRAWEAITGLFEVLQVTCDVETRVHTLRAVIAQLKAISRMSRREPDVLEEMVQVVGQVVAIELAWLRGVARHSVASNVWPAFEKVAAEIAKELADPAVAAAKDRADLYDALYHAVVDAGVVSIAAAAFLEWTAASYWSLATTEARQTR